MKNQMPMKSYKNADAALHRAVAKAIDLPLPLIVGRNIDPVLLTPLQHGHPTASAQRHDLRSLVELALLIVYL